MMENLVDIKIDKYRIYQEPSGHVWADRYDHKKWLDVTMTSGSKLMLAMAYEIERLREIEGKYLGLCK